MPYFQSTYHSRIFRDFKEIDAANYRRIIRFYEDKEEEIQRLDFDEYFELITAYVNALFEVGSYQKHLLMVDVVIEMAIVQNVEMYRGEDIYQKMLFRKAASLYNTLEYGKAEYILRELIKIDPHSEDPILFLRKCLRKKEPGFLNKAKAASILLFLLSAFVISVEVLFVRPFYKSQVDQIEASRTAIFLLGCAILVGGILLHRWLVHHRVRTFVEKTRNSKSY
ncbi:MAG: hypothetical protein KDD06_14185 [Phaeodactylibacter sp.]|nr:hypothetical protein [Phaeodactylibacter sp.]MCB9287990.1 hypothetical protein [Lewinellaceae bacterium]